MHSILCELAPPTIWKSIILWCLPISQVEICHLTQETISENLSLLCRTGDGLGHAFVRVDLKDKYGDKKYIQNRLHLPYNLELSLWFYTNVSFVITVLLRGLSDIDVISSFIHLRFLDLSNNHLTDLYPLQSLTQLLWLKARTSLLYSFRKGHLLGCQYHSL